MANKCYEKEAYLIMCHSIRMNETVPALVFTSREAADARAKHLAENFVGWNTFEVVILPLDSELPSFN